MTPLRFFTGPSLSQIRSDVASSLPVPDVRFGIVAGARGDGRGYNPLLPGDDDMTVSVASTMLDGAEDTFVVPAIHTFVMIHPEVVRGTLRYLRTGRFRD